MAEHECCICKKKKTAKTGSGYEELYKCVTENGARSLKQASVSNDFPFLHTEFAGTDWQTILTKEYFYHRSCYRSIVKKRDSNDTFSSDADKILQELIAIIEERVINSCEVLRMSDISTLYSEIRDRFSPEGDVTVLSAQKLKEKIQKNLCAKIGFWCPSHGSELVYNDSVDKGHLVEVAIRAKISKQKWEDKMLEEKTTDVAREIRKELLETPNTFSRYVTFASVETTYCLL